MLERRRDEFADLFREFVETYPATPAGARHVEMYDECRTQARQNLESVLAAKEEGHGITDLVLVRLLPYSDTAPNRAKGAWVYFAPSITGDLRGWFEKAGWTKPRDWPKVAEAILQFVVRCSENPSQLPAACNGFSESPYSKGFQTGMLTPILNALRPDDYALVNSKSRRVINYLCGTDHSGALLDYPSTNATVKDVVADVSEDMHKVATPDMRDDDLLDMFCHWLVAVKEYALVNGPVSYWKVAPGRNAWLWDTWREGGYVSVGWEALGDVSAVTREEFEARQTTLTQQSDDWSKAGTDQVWRFAHDIGEGDRVVANRGISAVLGIGTVAGGYYFVPGETHAHRLPVEWDDLTPRRVNQRGWRRTLVRLDREQFEDIRNAPPLTARQLAPPFSRLFADWEEAEWAFTLLGETLAGLGVTDADDERFLVSLRNTSQAGSGLRLVFGNWAVLGLQGPAGPTPRVELALLESRATDLERYRSFTFRQGEDEPKVNTYLLPLDMARENQEVLQTYRETLPVVANHFAAWTCSNFRRLNIPDVVQAILRPETLQEVLATGVTPPDVSGRFFSEETFILLAGLSARPTKDYYQEHQEEFTRHLKEPFEALMGALAQRLPPEAKALLETEEGLTSHILKNDFGQGGAWDHYWGAFYPKGSKRTVDAHLFVWMNRDALRFGFYIGDYGTEPWERFKRNLREYRDRLRSILGSTLGDMPELTFGFAEEPARTLREWLTMPSPSPRASLALSVDEVLALSRDDLATRGSVVFAVLFPLVLLATSDQPIADIEAYAGETPPPVIQPEYSLAQCSAETGFAETELQTWVSGLERKKQAILYGPPGTGKTYLAEHLARHLVGGTDGFVSVIQFHPAYAYEDFVQGIRPEEADDGGLRYPVVPGHFLEFCVQAADRRGPCVLIIDEINRAELSRVFGELMYLLEYRGKQVRLAADRRAFAIPENVRIIGTMNTADRSIALVDHALRRRFAFVALYPKYEVLRKFHAERTGLNVEVLIGTLARLNREIGDPNYAVGISFFLTERLEEDLAGIWQMEIVPYLEEYFFDQPERVTPFRWEEVKGRFALREP